MLRRLMVCVLQCSVGGVGSSRRQDCVGWAASSVGYLPHGVGRRTHCVGPKHPKKHCSFDFDFDDDDDDDDADDDDDDDVDDDDN